MSNKELLDMTRRIQSAWVFEKDRQIKMEQARAAAEQA